MEPQSPPRIRAWLSDDELVQCPVCEAKAAVAIADGSVVCTECDHVTLGAAVGEGATDAAA